MGVSTVVERTGIPGVLVLERTAHVDRRGSFDRLVDVELIAEAVAGFSVEQVNLSVTRGAGTVRGLHYQSGPEAEVKVVTCLAGMAFDVAVDLRAGSATFLQWHGVVLEGGVGRSFVVPAGCAHGFQVLSEECTLLYAHSTSYRPEFEGGVHPGDPRVSVGWPEAVVGLSERDSSFPHLSGDWEGLSR
jgi:dTDP-4-dehydrorhamnose 3,5-epimerase